MAWFALLLAVVLPAKQVAGGVVTALPQPFAPPERMAGPCVLRYIESRPDDHLDLRIRTVDGQILLSDAATARLQGCTYTLNGWTDPEDASRLVDEPIEPYTVYHVTKASIAAPMREWWRCMPEFARKEPVEVRRGEVFFVAVPEAESWNGVGEGANPIGRPLAFSQLPPFTLANHVYGFEARFVDEADERLDELGITFNRRPGQRHTMLYSEALETFLRAKGYDKDPRKPAQEFSEQDCIDFADSLPLDAILAFDIEPPAEWRWMVDYSHPRFAANMARIVRRLNERGAKAYNWMSRAAFRLDAEPLEGSHVWGPGNGRMDSYLAAYAHPERVEVDDSPYGVMCVGFGYDSYDYNYLPDDEGARNSSPQALYLRALDACELSRRVYAGRDLLAFVWGFMESDIGTFPRNHVVEVPQIGASARRVDNKPLYPPSYWQDSMTLSLLYCRYLFYWGPGAVSWDPAAVARYAKGNLRPGEIEVWELLEGEAPEAAEASYPGKESMIYNATIGAAWRYAQVQEVCDGGTRHAVATTYRRAGREGTMGEVASYPDYPDGSQFVQAARNRQPFTIVVEDPSRGRKVVFFQDVWCRPGRHTEFGFTFDGKLYTEMRTPDGKAVRLRTDGNRLFIGVME